MPACGLADSVDTAPVLMELRAHNRRRRNTRKQTHTAAQGGRPIEEPPGDRITDGAEDTFLARMAGEAAGGEPIEAETWEGKGLAVGADRTFPGERASRANVLGQESAGWERRPGAEFDFRCSRILWRVTCHLTNLSGQEADQ